MYEGRVSGSGLLCISLLFILTTTFLTQTEFVDGVMINMMGERDITLPHFRNMNPCNENPECLNGYIPEYICVSPDTSVTWVNVGEIYRTATSGDEIEGPSGEFDSNIVESGQNFTHKFTQEGKVTYFDKLYEGISGTVEVDENCNTPITKHDFNGYTGKTFNSNGTKYTIYDNDTYGIEIQYPMNWKKENINASGLNNIIALSLDFSNTTSGHVSIWIDERKNETLEQIRHETTKCNKDNDDNLKVIEIDNNKIFANSPSYSIICTYDPGSSFDRGEREIMNFRSIVNDKIISINYDNSIRSFPIYLPIIDRIIESLKLT